MLDWFAGVVGCCVVDIIVACGFGVRLYGFPVSC